MISTVILAKLCGFVFSLQQSPVGPRCVTQVDYKTCSVSAQCQGEHKTLTCSKRASPDLVATGEIFYANGHWKANLQCLED